jgi:CheY-like chemotaxis protein
MNMHLPIHSARQGKTVLCIDDDEDVLECERAFLESFGYTVLIAPSGNKALELASIHSIDVVVVDYVMPEMNGHQVVLEMRQLRPKAPIIMVSGAVDLPEQVLKSVDAFVGKCELARELLPAISHCLEC